MKLIASAAALIMMTAGAQAKPGLENEREITEGLIALGMASQIADTCPDLDGRTLLGWRYIMQLKRIAQGKGYSDAEIDAFVGNSAQRSRLETTVYARLAAKGAPRGDAAAHCQVGRGEIASGTVIGRFLSD